MASVPSNLEKRTPILREVELLETRLALDTILVTSAIQDWNAIDQSIISPETQKSPDHH